MRQVLSWRRSPRSRFPDPSRIDPPSQRPRLNKTNSNYRHILQWENRIQLASRLVCYGLIRITTGSISPNPHSAASPLVPSYRGAMRWSVSFFLSLLPLAGLAGKSYSRSRTTSCKVRTQSSQNSTSTGTYSLKDLYQGQSFLSEYVATPLFHRISLTRLQ